MNESDKKVRRQWIVLWFLSIAITTGTTLLYWWCDPSAQVFTPTVRCWIAGISILSMWGFSWIFYYCIYRKPGTKLLTILLIMSSISSLISPILFLSGKIQPPVYIPFYGAYLVLTQAIGLYWIVVCWKMRKINKRLQTLSSASATGS